MTDDLAPTTVNFETDEDELTVHAIISSAVEDVEYSEEWLEQELTKQGFSGLTVSKTAHEEIAQLVSNNQPGKVRIGIKINARADAFLSDDLLSASLRITAAKAGQAVVTQDVVDALNAKEINLALVNKNRIVGLLKKSHIIAPGETVEVEIAKGTAPEHGKDTQFECLIDDIADRKPNERSDGTLDYYDLGEIVSVDEQCPLMRKCAPTPSKNGRSVNGHELPARIGKHLNFKKCKGASVSPADSDLLVSSIKGQPVIVDKGITVDSVYTVKSVDLHTGHIDYDGTLVVKGDVASGMSIKVSGDVQVFGLVENASIEAGGNVDLKLGAIGHAEDLDKENCVHIKCKGNLLAGYLENMSVNVEGDVLIKSRISNCKLKAGHQVIVGNKRQEKSGIVGGHVSAGSIIRAESLGSSGCTLTHVEIACSAELLEKYETLKKEIVRHDELLIQMLGLQVSLSKKRTEAANKLLQDTKKQTEEIKALIDGFFKQKEELETTIERVSKGKVIVQKEAFPAVTIKILDQEQKIKAKYGKGTFLLFEGTMSHNASVK